MRQVKDQIPDYLIFSITQEQKLNIELENIDPTIFVTDERLLTIKKVTLADQTLQTLMQIQDTLAVSRE